MRARLAAAATAAIIAADAGCSSCCWLTG